MLPEEPLIRARYRLLRSLSALSFVAGWLMANLPLFWWIGVNSTGAVLWVGGTATVALIGMALLYLPVYALRVTGRLFALLFMLLPAGCWLFLMLAVWVFSNASVPVTAEMVTIGCLVLPVPMALLFVLFRFSRVDGEWVREQRQEAGAREEERHGDSRRGRSPVEPDTAWDREGRS